ncbi:MAG: HIT domain-containing protein [Asticcacaulis sp.]
MEPFIADARLLQSSHPVTSLALCDVRLQDDARYLWAVLIPRRADKREIEDLESADQTQLLAEMLQTGRAVRRVAEALGLAHTKLNMANLGNVVPQLHIHVINRHEQDPAWPGPVWGHSPSRPYTESEHGLARVIDALKAALLDA